MSPLQCFGFQIGCLSFSHMRHVVKTCWHILLQGVSQVKKIQRIQRINQRKMSTQHQWHNHPSWHIFQKALSCDWRILGLAYIPRFSCFHDLDRCCMCKDHLDQDYPVGDWQHQLYIINRNTLCEGILDLKVWFAVLLFVICCLLLLHCRSLHWGSLQVVLLTMEECNAMMGDDYPADN